MRRKSKIRPVKVAVILTNTVLDDAGHAASETQDEPASSGAKKPRTNKRGRTTSEIHAGTASTSPATLAMKPTESLRGTNKRSHGDKETHEKIVPHGPATSSLKSTQHVPDHNFADHQRCDLHSLAVSSTDAHLPVESHSMCDTHVATAVGDSHGASDSRLSPIISKINELWKNRQAWHRAEKSLTLQGKAQCRRFTEGDKDKANKLFAELEGMVDGQSCGETQKGIVASAILPFIEARASLIDHRKLIEKELVKMAKVLPVYPWTEKIRGFGPLSLAAIIGCTTTTEEKSGRIRGLSDYPTVSKLWKRMGLAVIGGKRQRRVRDAIEALEHGFSPERAAVMFNIGGALIGGMGHGPRPKVGEDVSTRDDLSPYQKRFIELIRKEVERVTDTWNGPEHKREPVEKKGELYESYSSHAAARIRRRIAKEFLRDLWIAQRGLNRAAMEPAPHISGPTPMMEAAE